MDKTLSRLSEWMARPTSRRGFVGRLGKAAFGGAALMSGGVAAIALDRGTALAAPQCCNGSASCSTNFCPGNTSTNFVNACCNVNGDKYYCYDCKSIPSGDYVCTIAVFQAHNCPMAPTKL